MSIKASPDKKYWIDATTGNKWSKDKYSKAEALELSKTLIMCSYCADCRDCSFCIGCEKCTHCDYCRDCARCKSCSFSDRCSACTDCRSCWSCSDSTYCTYCKDSDGCEYAWQCDSCTNISGLVHAIGIDYDEDAPSSSNLYGIIGPVMGSRKATPIVQYDDKGNIITAVGCFRGTLDELRYRVKSTYPNKKAKHRRRYMAFIKAVRAFVSAVTDPDPDIED